jgi:hypothetical protein
MADTIAQRHGVTVLLCAPDGTKLGNDSDAVELIGQALQHRADLVVIAATRLDDRFFTLSTRVAGEIIQKFVNYRLRLAIVGDITQHLTDSSALRDFVYESNRGRQIWFVTDIAQLDARLEKARSGDPG